MNQERSVGPPRGAVSPARVIVVTGVLALAGAIAGAGVAFVILSGLAIVLTEPSLFGLSTLGSAAAIGAAAGALLGPAIAWLFLRTVPLGRAILQTSVGAAIGAALALAFPGFGPWMVLGMATAGALLAALRLRLKARKSGP